MDGLPAAWHWQAAYSLLEEMEYKDVAVGTSFRKGETKTWAFWAIQPDGVEDCVEIELIGGRKAYVNPAYGTATKGKKGAAPTKMGAGGTTVYHATNPLKPKPPEPELVPPSAKPSADTTMKASDESPRRKAKAAAELAAKKMHVPPRIEAERQGAQGQGKCCFDAFAQMVNFLKEGKEQTITHVETRTAAVQGMLDPGNKWLEGFWDKLTPDGSGDKLESGLYSDYIERMKKPDAWGSVLELAVLARKYRVNIVLYTEGRTHPEFIPGSSQAVKRARFLTGVMGFQEKHFFWYKFKWITAAAQAEGPGSVEFANFNYIRRGGVIERVGWNRTGCAVREKTSLEEKGFRVTDGHVYARPPRLRCAAAYVGAGAWRSGTSRRAPRASSVSLKARRRSKSSVTVGPCSGTRSGPNARAGLRGLRGLPRRRLGRRSGRRLGRCGGEGREEARSLQGLRR